MVEWTEVEPGDFEKYLDPKPVKGRDSMDDVLDAVAAGKTIELTLVDANARRGRRMSLARRAKVRGLVLQMRSLDNKIIVRQEGASEPQPEKPRAPRKRTD